METGQLQTVANGRSNKGRKGDSGRDPGGFVALPWSVIDSPAFAGLSHPARALLLEIARQYVRDNNGRLLASAAHLSKRGWNSSDVITRAKRELLAAGFIHETVKGHRPNKASWYAVTWQNLDHLSGYDVGAVETFQRSAYRTAIPLKNASLRPSRGVEAAPIAPSRGAGKSRPTPSRGAINVSSAPPATPSHGNHLEMPSAETFSGASEQTSLQVKADVAQPSPPSMGDSASGDRDQPLRRTTSDSSTQFEAQSTAASTIVFQGEDDFLNSLHVIRYIEEQERAERARRMQPGEVDEFEYTKEMYEEEARGLEELSKLFRPRPC